jgi:hypothetical protein
VAIHLKRLGTNPAETVSPSFVAKRGDMQGIVI